MLNLYASLIILMTIGLFLISISLDLKTMYKKIKVQVIKEKDLINKTISNSKITRITKFIETTEQRIQMSNIRLYFSHYGVLMHFILCTVSGIVAFLWISKYMNIFISLFFSTLGLCLPFFILQFMKDVMNDRIKKHIVDFLTILKNFLVATGDIFIAFEKSKDYFIEPLKTYTDIMVYQYKHKVNPINCIDNFINKIQHKELQLFMENLKICIIHGGDIVGLIDEYINEIGTLNDDSDKEDAEDQILKVGLYLMLILNFSIIYGLLNSNYRLEITNTIYGNIVFTLDIIIALYIGYGALDRVS